MNLFDWDAARKALLALIADKKSVREIAEKLGTTPGSVAGHLHTNRDLKALKPTDLTEVKSVPGERRIPLLKIASQGQCRWPVADDPAYPPNGILCCGAPSGDGVYCIAHRKLAYQKPRGGGGDFVLTTRKSNAKTAEEKVT